MARLRQAFKWMGAWAWTRRQWNRWRPYSLARMARKEKARLATEPRYLRARQRGAAMAIELLRDELSFLWLAPLAFLLLIQPWVYRGGFSVFGHDERTSSNFLGILWQVQGAALGLSLAVVLFAFQSVHGNRHGVPLRDFAEETWLFPIFYAGLIGLLLDGTVLLHAGQGAPGGWAASWATIWAAGTAVALGFLFVFTVHALDPRVLQTFRLRRTRRAIESAIEDVIFRRVALVVLDQFCKANAIGYASLFGRAAQGAVPVRARREGEVRDIRLRWLRQLAADAAARGVSQLLLRAEIGTAVRPGTDLAAIDASYQDAASRIARSFRIRRLRRDAFRSVLDDLHEDADRAIRTPSPATYSAIAELYEHLLLVFPETWARYGQQYTGGIAGGANPFELSVQDYVERQLYEEMTLAARSGSRDIAHDALDLPIGVAQRALELRALALTTRMLSLWVAARRSMLRDADDEDTRNLLAWSWLRLSEYALRPEMFATEDDSDDGARQLGKDALLQVWDGYATLCKDILDVRPRDTDLLSQINEVWDQPLRLWNPEHADPQDWQLEFAIERGESADVIERLRRDLAANRRRIDVKQELVDWRALHRFGLLFWILRNVRDRGDVERWMPAWKTFSGYFGDVPRLAKILDKGIEADWEDRGRWSNWVLDTLSKREVHGLAVDLEFIQTFVVLALSLTSPAEPAPQIEPLKFGRGRLENPRETVEGIIAIENLKPLLPADRLDERVELLVAALEQMQRVQKEREEQSVIDAPLDAELVDEFTEKLRAAWRTSRTLRVIFDALGALDRIDGALDERRGSQVKRWFLKSVFIREPRVYGLEHTAEESGRGLALWEWRALLDKAEDSPAAAVEDGMTAGERLRSALTELREAGYQPSLVLVPIDWRLYQALELRPAPERGGDAPKPTWLEDIEGRSGFLGSVNDVPVLEHHHVPENRVYVFDLARFARFREPDVVDPAGPVTVEVTVPDEEKIRELVREERVEFHEELEDEAKVRRLQQQVVVDAIYPFQIDVLDAGAARRVDVAGAVPEV
jgi:hypothetical protein